MGAAISAIRKELKAADEAAEKEAKEKLEFLESMVDAKLNEYQAKLEQNFLNPAATAKTQIPGIRALRWSRHSTCKISDKPSEEVDNAIDSFFGKKEEGSSGSTIQNGFKHVVKGALNVFLGNTEAGEQDDERYFIYMDRNAVVRVDIKLWRYNFAGKGFSDTYQNVLGYIFCLSIVDPSKLNTAEFVYLISEYAGDKEDDATAYMEAMEKIYQRARKLKTAIGPSPPYE